MGISICKRCGRNIDLSDTECCETCAGSAGEVMSLKEQVTLALVAGGFLAVFTFLGFLAWQFEFDVRLFHPLEIVQETFQESGLRMAIAAALGVVMIPAFVCFLYVSSLVVLFSVVRGRHNAVTRWFWREIDAEPKQRELQESHGQHPDETKPPFGARFLPPAVGWAILAGAVLLGTSVLLYVALFKPA